MQVEQIKPALIEKLKDTRKSIDAFYASLTQEERDRPGTLKEWQARDIVIHGNEWCKMLNRTLLDIQQGNEPHLEEDYLAFNDRRYEALKDQSWEDTLADIDDTYRQLFEFINQYSPEELTDPEFHAIFKGQTVLSQITGSYINHPEYHLADYEVKNGRGDAAIQRMLKMADSITQFDDSPRTKGTTLYNVACFFCMMDKKEQALENLVIAFENAPDLKPWAREDGDLANLHQDERFQALTETD